MGFVSEVLKDIKIQHTIFALPFALMSAFIAAGGLPSFYDIGLIVVAMVFARSAAMAFNRIADEKWDKDNPRTRARALPSGAVKREEYITFTIASSLGFVATCSMINTLALALSPVALIIMFAYSFTKRFTPYSHFVLGLALAIAPVGAWVVVRDEIALEPLILAMSVVFWLAGLDIIYSCQDVEFDSDHGLQSIPQRFGVAKALKLAMIFHVVMIVSLLALANASHLGSIYLAGVVFTAGMLLYEHRLVRPDDLQRVNVAFFNVNGIISVGLAIFTILDTVL